MTKKLLVFILFSTFISFYSYSQTVTLTTPGAGTVTVPCDVTSIDIEIWGAGGGGQRVTGNGARGGGGSGGGYIRTVSYSVTPGITYNYFVGTGGSGNPGNNGQASWFDTAGTLLAVGGNGAGPAESGNNQAGLGAIAPNSGNIGGVDVNTYGGNGANALGGGGGYSGGSGSSAGATIGNNATGFTGGVAPTDGYAGVDGRVGNADGRDGNTGSGGSGAFASGGGNRNGGNGGDGQIRITYTSTLLTYCVTGWSTATEAITNVTFAGINNTTGANATGGNHEYFCDTATVAQGGGYSISVNGDTEGNFDNGVIVYFDWDQDGNFTDIGEDYIIGILTNNDGTGTPVSTTINVPAGATLGNTTMRVMKMFNAYPGSCYNSVGYGQTEDYVVNVVVPPPCTTPADQPTLLTFNNITQNSIDGSFTAAPSAPSNYLVVRNTTNIEPTPTDFTNYAIGGTVGAGNIVVDNDTDTNFSATGLASDTQYYFFIFSFNDSGCTGGPLYNSVSPLTDNEWTLSHCQPTTESPAGDYINSVEFIGTLNDIQNLNNGFATGYQDFTYPEPVLPADDIFIAQQQQGEAINIYMEGANSRGRFKAWVDWDKDGTFDEATEKVYDSGGIMTVSTTFGFSIPLGQAIGYYTIRLRFYHESNDTLFWDFTPCQDFIDYIIGSDEYGEAEDYTFKVLPLIDARIVDVTYGQECGVNQNVDLSFEGNAGVTGFNIYATETGGAPFAPPPNIAGTTGTWQTPPISTTTNYWVTAINGSGESYERVRVRAFINPAAVLTFGAIPPSICGESLTLLPVTAQTSSEIGFLIDEEFETGGSLGTFTGINIVTNGGTPVSQWQQRTSTFIPNEQVWFPAISSGLTGDGFAMSNADTGVIPTHNELRSSLLDASNYTTLTLELDMYFSRYNLAVPEDVNIEMSRDNGASWLPADVIAQFTDDVGYGSNFAHLTYNLIAFTGAGNNQLRLRIRYYSDWGDGVAVDNIQLYGNTVISPAADWTFNAADIEAYTDAPGTTPYVQGTTPALQTIYIRPTAAGYLKDEWSFNASATLPNLCIANGNFDMKNFTRTWSAGAGNASWDNLLNWHQGTVPDANSCVIVPNVGGPDPSTGIPLPPATPRYAYNLKVESGGFLELGASSNLTVTDQITVEPGGLFHLKNNSNLVQINNVVNSGDIYVERAPGNGAAVNNLNYVYWSSPVLGFDFDDISPGTGTGLKWHWLPNGAQGGAFDHGEWLDAAGATMTTGKGYINRGLSGVALGNFAIFGGFPGATLTSNSTLFEGQPINGDISTAISRGNYNVGGDPGYAGNGGSMAFNNDDNWNLIGNPYPSSISADIFIDRNFSAAGSWTETENNGLAANQVIDGTIWLWPHGELPNVINNDPFYDDFGSNYADQYVPYNLTGSPVTSFPGYIASGQAFFVLADHNSPSPTNNVLFHNGMRSAVFDNGNFLNPNGIDKDKPVKTVINEKHRIWLNLVKPDNYAKAILVGYVDGATNDYDGLYDGYEFPGNELSFYSVLGEKELAIQGKALPFTEEDIIPLGMVIPSSDIYKIAINQVDGLFESEAQNIYLEDTFTNTIHDLRASPYSFTTEAGTFNDRFILRYTYDTLGISEFDKSDLTIIGIDDTIKISSKNLPINTITVYDLLGKAIIELKDQNILEYRITNSNLASGVYIVKATLYNGLGKNKKVIIN